MNAFVLTTAILIGAFAGNLASEMTGETVAHIYNNLYESGFYQMPEPVAVAAGASEVAALGQGGFPEDAYLEKLCKLPPTE